MAVMLSKTYDAFIAAEELAAHEARFVKIEQDLAVLKWMVGVVIAGVASLVIKAFA
jgi:hypothetical protein